MVMAVALLTESVDWNPSPIGLYRRNTSRSPHGERGLKCRLIILRLYCHLSLSSRRAWIEMLNLFESITDIIASLSSRRAWIEISLILHLIFRPNSRSPRGERGLKFFELSVLGLLIGVALLAESVDWNCSVIVKRLLSCCRSPRGERGLKCGRSVPMDKLARRSPRGERGLK